MQKCICVGSFLCATALNVHLVEVSVQKMYLWKMEIGWVEAHCPCDVCLHWVEDIMFIYLQYSSQSVAALVIQEGNCGPQRTFYRCQRGHNLTACQSASPGGHIGICGPDASVMDFPQMLLCFISVMLSFCVSCNCTDEETESSGDQASRLRHMWQLSMRDAKIREKGKI